MGICGFLEKLVSDGPHSIHDNKFSFFMTSKDDTRRSSTRMWNYFTIINNSKIKFKIDFLSCYTNVDVRISKSWILQKKLPTTTFIDLKFWTKRIYQTSHILEGWTASSYSLYNRLVTTPRLYMCVCSMTSVHNELQIALKEACKSFAIMDECFD